MAQVSEAPRKTPAGRWIRRLILGVPLACGFVVLGAAGALALSPEESCFTNSINSARANNGRAALSTDGALVTVARRHSQRMADSGTIFHNSNLANEAPPGWRSLGENVGTGPTCEAIHNAFMNSAAHKTNILDPDFNFVGVGVVITSGGQIYVTEVFMEKASQPAPNTPPPTSSQPPAPKPPALKKPVAPKPTPPPVAESPPPPPPPPPGFSVAGQALAYRDLLDKETLPAAEERAAYAAFVEEQAAARATAEAERRAISRERGVFARVAALVGAILSGAV